VGYTHNMHVTTDERRRVTLPKSARPGQIYAVEEPGEGKFVLTRLEKPQRKARLVREGRYLVGVTEHPITQEMVRKLQDEFP
jgi:hypothetical protein